jgi:hypothetical protein
MAKARTHRVGRTVGSKVRPAESEGAPVAWPGGPVVNAYPDSIDFRDLMYVPTLVEVDEELPLAEYEREATGGKKTELVLNQGREGACTGFALAAVVQYLLRTRDRSPDHTPVSARMLYECARRYDEWPGEGYSGSSARGAMKGWHKHGVCSAAAWPYQVDDAGGGLTAVRAKDALARPLGAYFRVDHKNLVAMHAALTEVGILYATAGVHQGWSEVGSNGFIAQLPGRLGGHAFAIVGYDREGFWIQNSWGMGWGKGGFGRIGYADWLENGTDVWVARLAVPIAFAEAASAAGKSVLVSRSVQTVSAEVRAHLVSIGNEGALRPEGTFGTSAADVARLVRGDFVSATRGWKRRRLLLYAHGGLVDERSAVQRTSEYLPPLLENEVYPVAFIWKSDAWSTITNILQDAFTRRRPEGLLDAAKDFMLDRLDDTLEPLARLPGKALWDEMKENALMASTAAAGGARQFLDHLAAVLGELDGPRVELHVAGHSAGSIFMAPIVQRLTAPAGQSTDAGPGLGCALKTCTLWAPACTAELFEQRYLPAVQAGSITSLALFTLTDAAEQDDHCANIYHKSLLYLVARALEKDARVPFFRPDGTPILGMATTVGERPKLKKLFANNPNARHITAPNGEELGSEFASTASHHGDFDDDEATVRGLLRRIVGASPKGSGEFAFARSPSSTRSRRQALA